MIRKLLFSLVVVGFGVIAVDEAKAMSCFIYCPQGMQQQIIGYQMYPYYTPRLTYDLNYGYAPIYGGMSSYGGYNPYGGGYGPYYGNGYGGYGGYNPNWYNQGFPFSYPRGMVNLRPRSGTPSGGTYVGYSSSRSTPRDPKPEPRPSVVPPPPVEAPAPKPPVEEVVDCKDLEKISRQRTTLAGDANGERCNEAAERFKKKTDRVYITHYNMAESSLCTIRYMDKKDYDKCVKPTTPTPSVPAPVPPAPAAGEPPRDRSRDCIAGQEQNCKPAQTYPLPDSKPVGCAPGFVQYGKDMNHCIPCNGVGNIIENGNCTCRPEYGVEQLNNGQVRCIPPSRATEGAVPACKDGNCPEVTSPVIDVSSNLCRDDSLGIDFDCECKDVCDTTKTGAYCSKRIFQREKPISINVGYYNDGRELNARCIHNYMKKGSDLPKFIDCSSGSPKEVTKPYCLDRNYFQTTVSSFNEAAECILSPDEHLAAINFFGHESRFHVDAIYTNKDKNDYSVGAGQLTFQDRGALQDFTKDPNKFKRMVKGSSCEAAVNKAIDRINDTDRRANNYCIVTGSEDNPETSMFLSMVFFKYYKEKELKPGLEKGFRCSDGSTVDRSSFDVTDSEMEVVYNQLMAIRYNAGFGKVQSSICGFMRIKKGEEGTARALGMSTGQKLALSDFKVTDTNKGFSGYTSNAGHGYIKKVISDTTSIAPECRGNL